MLDLLICMRVQHNVCFVSLCIRNVVVSPRTTRSNVSEKQFNLAHKKIARRDGGTGPEQAPDVKTTGPRSVVSNSNFFKMDNNTAFSCYLLSLPLGRRTVSGDLPESNDCYIEGPLR